jgi:hypothetical protein
MTCTTLVGFTIKKKVAQDTTWTPEETVGPALNTALVLVEDKD